LEPGWPRFNFKPKSGYKVLDEELNQLWNDYRENLENFRLNVPEFNSLFLNIK
jgi:hypothetical protein